MTTSRRYRRRRSRCASQTSQTRRRSSRRQGSRSTTSGTPASATAPASATPPAIAFSSTAATSRMSRPDAVAAYAQLPLPDTTQEHWRFTDLKGFDPDSFGHGQGQTRAAAPKGMLDLDVAGLATITESSVEIERAPEGITFAPLTEEHERLYSLVGWDEKFAAHNAAVWEHGLLVVVPKGVELDKPLYVRVTNSTEGGSLLWRLLVVAEEGARFTLVEEVSST